MTKKYPDVEGLKAWICRNCGNDPVIERDPEFTNAKCPRCGETKRLRPKDVGPP